MIHRAKIALLGVVLVANLYGVAERIDPHLAAC